MAIRGRKYSFRVSEQESEDFEEQRKVAGLSVSEYVRRRILGFRIVSKIDLRVLGELKRQGGLIKHLYKLTRGMYSQDMAEAIQALTSCVRKLERIITNDSQNTPHAP